MGGFFLDHRHVLTASLDRILSYVRISVTDRCNFRCKYCMPESGVEPMDHRRIMTYEDIVFLCEVMSFLGVRRVRFTGGEPFVRKGFVPFLSDFRDRLPHLSVAVTTNGSLVEPFAPALGELNLDGISVSLDSLDKSAFSDITRCGRLSDVVKGIRALRKHTDKVKINTVLIKGFNDHQLGDLLKFSADEGVLLRIIEFMPLDSSIWFDDSFISVDDMIDRLPNRQDWILEGPSLSPDSGPAVYYRNVVSGQRVGFIAAVSHHFCDSCNRLRVTSEGEMRPCLFSPDGERLLPALRDRDRDELVRLIRLSAAKKPRCWMDVASGDNHMSSIGG
ncbi:MAG: GTP 3',8-cyclase MoaA [Synergistales bacterium]|nr:GTP 3',8-cyclase MoaA [Synergistales bacterium]